MRSSGKLKGKKQGLLPKKPYPGKKIVVLALPLLTENEIPLIQGVREQLRHEGNLELLVQSGAYEATLRKLAGEEHLAGAIGEFMSDRWMEPLLRKGIPMIRLGSGAGGVVPAVTTDVNAMAVEAAGVLRERGVTCAAYLGAPGPHGSQSLAEAFAAACAGEGLPMTRCPAPSSHVLRHFLETLPRPAGLLCLNDSLARLAIVTAREAGIQVPGDLAIIGTGDSRIESIHAGIGISSFEHPLGEIGRRAAFLLLRMIRGDAPTEHSVQVISPVLHERESTLGVSAGVARALAHLKSNPGTPMTAGELARMAGMSRRSFEIAMRRGQGCSPGELLASRRRERAEKLLRESDLKIGRVGEECGYSEVAVFSAAFRRWTGKSPREYRNHCRSHGPPQISQRAGSLFSASASPSQSTLP